MSHAAEQGVMAQVGALRRRRHSVRISVAAIVAVAMIPVVAMVAWLTTSWAASERARLELNADHKAHELVADIDREIVAATSMLTALATSRALREGDLDSFRRKAAEVARQLDVRIELRDPNAKAPMRLPGAAGAPPDASGLPGARDETDQLVAQSGSPAVSNVFSDPASGQLVVGAIVPVRREATNLLLSVNIPAQRLASDLAAIDVSPGGIATVLDRNNVIVARSERHAEFAGRKVAVLPPPGSVGVVRANSQDDIPFQWFFRRSELTGWVIAIGIPESVLDGPSQRARTGIMAAGGVLFAAMIALSYYWAGRLSRSLGALGIDRRPTREEFQVLFDSSPNGVIVVDGDGLIALANVRMERMFGYNRGQLVGRRVESLIPDRFRGTHAQYRNPFAAAHDAATIGARPDLVGLRNDGSEFPIEINFSPMRTSAGNFVIVTVADISARKRSAERLDAALAERDDLRRRFMQAQEQERLRLAHDLHDRTGQSLTAAMLELKGIEASVDEHGRNRLRQLRKQMEEMGKTLHRVAWELRPASIDELGLVSALANYVSEWSTQYGIEADFHSGDDKLDQLSDEVRTTIYRVVQEGLTNIAKHARQTSTVSVVVERFGTALRLMIEDDGCGFGAAAGSEPAAERSDGLGLAGMRERLALIGGTLEIESSPGAGTTLFARIPLEQE